MTYDEAVKILAERDQAHVLSFWNRLSDCEKASLLEQIAEIDFDALSQCQALLKAAGKADSSAAKEELPMEPAPVAELEGAAREEMAAVGEAELTEGHVGIIVVAGGQGSRLGFEGPKGCYPIGPMSDATLFHFHARHVLGLTRQFGKPVPFYIMTSRTNDAATRAFFKDNNYFGLDEKDVFFFTQGMWPALTSEGKIILDAPGHIFLGPDGHGGMLAALDRSGALADMKARGLKSIFYFQVDNPMVNLAEPVFVGFHTAQKADFSIKVCAKRDPNEGVGVVVKRGDKMQIVEYTEFTDEQKNERLPDGELRFKFGSVAIHIFSYDFLVREATAGLPIHIAHKKVPYVDAEGQPVKPASPNAYKFEKFIFDIVEKAEVCSCLAFDRTDEFSPVKNAEGNDSPATCRADLSRKWARWLNSIGYEVPVDENGYPVHKLEIDPGFAQNAKVLKQKLAGKCLDLSKDLILQ